MSYTPGPWKIGAFDQYGGYDMMTSGVSAGPACLPGRRVLMAHHTARSDASTWNPMRKIE